MGLWSQHFGVIGQLLNEAKTEWDDAKIRKAKDLLKVVFDTELKEDLAVKQMHLSINEVEAQCQKLADLLKRLEMNIQMGNKVNFEKNLTESFGALEWIGKSLTSIAQNAKTVCKAEEGIEKLF